MKILFTIIPQIASALSPDTGGRMWLWLHLMYFAISRKFFMRGKCMEFTFFYEGRPFRLFLSRVTDLAVLHEVFCLKEYEWKLQNDLKVIIDLGAHWGDSSVYYHLLYPQATIYALEPAPDTYAQLLKNIADIPNIIPLQAGVADYTGTAELNICSSSFGNSLQKRSGTQGVITVPVYTMQDLFSKLGIDHADLIKFDIEGAEEKLFTTQNPTKYSDAYIGEVHEDLISVDSKEFVDRFKDFAVEKNSLSNLQRFILKATKKMS